VIEHAIQVPVRWSDVDPAGIAYYPRFFSWYDLGSEALFESLGLPWPTLFPERGIIGVPIVETGSTFTRPLRYGDVVTLRTSVPWVKAKTFRMEHEITLAGVRCATGFEVRAWIPRPRHPHDPIHAAEIPADVVRKLTGS
jgi:YbgC/YbaW family acyl-CoA thioester hydrolase